MWHRRARHDGRARMPPSAQRERVTDWRSISLLGAYLPNRPAYATLSGETHECGNCPSGQVLDKVLSSCLLGESAG